MASGECGPRRTLAHADRPVRILVPDHLVQLIVDRGLVGDIGAKELAVLFSAWGINDQLRTIGELGNEVGIEGLRLNKHVANC